MPSATCQEHNVLKSRSMSISSEFYEWVQTLHPWRSTTEAKLGLPDLIPEKIGSRKLRKQFCNPEFWSRRRSIERHLS